MKTSELQGDALDLAVGLAMGRKPNDFGWWWDNFKPSTNWAFSGPIIEQEGLCLSYDAFVKRWNCSTPVLDSYQAETPLIAAMRCYVASKLGDTIDIPKELT